MQIQRILCPIDFSEPNEAANQYASLLAKMSGAKLIYLHIWLPDTPYGSYVYMDVDEEQEKDRERLEQIKPTQEGVSASYVIEFGAPAQRIVEYANENHIDLIVMPTHGRTGLRRVLMGSVTEEVVRKAECPVLAVKPGSAIPDRIDNPAETSVE